METTTEARRGDCKTSKVNGLGHATLTVLHAFNRRFDTELLTITYQELSAVCISLALSFDI